MSFDDDQFADEGLTEGDKRKRLLGLVAFVIFFLAVGTVLVLVFIFFTNSWTLAIMLVGFMMLYMTLMGWLAARKAHDKDL